MKILILVTLGALLLVIGALLLVTGAPSSRWGQEFELNENAFDSEAMQMIRTDTGLNLPDGVRGLNFRYSPPIDPAFVARIEIPAESQDQVLKQIEAIPIQEINISGGPGEKVGWWPPPKELVIIDRHCHQSDGDYFRAALSKEDNRIILYVEHAVF